MDREGEIREAISDGKQRWGRIDSFDIGKVIGIEDVEYLLSLIDELRQEIASAISLPEYEIREHLERVLAREERGTREG